MPIRNIYKLFILCMLFMVAENASVKAQSTFDLVYDLFQEKCSGCHGGASPQGNLDLSGSPTDMYAALIEADPTNPTAASKGLKLIDIGYPERSFLLHKIGTSEWDEAFNLSPGEGDIMPPSPLPTLNKREMELVRQWILDAAPVTGEVVDPQLLEDYYDNGMGLPGIEAPDPPAEGEGFQIRLGPIFLEPQGEIEFFKRYDLQFSNSTEINRMDLTMNDESHHFIVYLGNANTPLPEGLRPNTLSMTGANDVMISAWQNNGDLVLPEKTAFIWPNNSRLDLNYHLKNYSSTGVLAAEVYLNVYTQESGTAQTEMYSELLPINLNEMFFGAPLGNGLIIPNNGSEITFTDHIWFPNSPLIPFDPGTWYVWSLATHTHGRAIDYDIYVAEPGGEKGEQIYEGFYNFDYTFNQGFYDWEHPPVRYFDPLFPLEMGPNKGIVHEATYVNDGPFTLYWGDTTDDEMMLLLVQFTLDPILSNTEEVEFETVSPMIIAPNPIENQTSIQYELKRSANVSLEVFNAIGKKVKSIVNADQSKGNYQFEWESNDLSTGIYLVRLEVDGQISTQKVIKN